MSPESRISHLLLRQDGMVTLAQAVDAGVSARTVQRRVCSKEWRRLLPRVFLVAGQRHVSFPRVYRAYCRNLGAHGFARVGDLLVAAADRGLRG